MARTIYENNDVEIVLEFDDQEAKVNVVGEGNLIWISSEEAEDFRL